MERIFIVGYMGSGKTTIGKRLARSFSLSFVDLDAYIENKYRKTVPVLFAEKGEEGFRKIESQVLREVAEFENIVISTGGGTPCFFDNMEVMNRAGVTIYLEAHPEELADRLLASKTVRPLIAGKPKEELIPFITEHLARRECYYNKAQIVYHIDRMITKEEIHLTVRGIKEQLKNRRTQ
ncbi:shikimate kinase [uncultured Proteiniphilum sp.]|uniref:shikimate kinase n=1 Tax=uncultured Proteiniphilum sp. TaxID=497637 RepID=UPI0026379A64|nr:shikimate kinase [uncultured Proteiniphilum sp.]